MNLICPIIGHVFKHVVDLGSSQYSEPNIINGHVFVNAGVMVTELHQCERCKTLVIQTRK